MLLGVNLYHSVDILNFTLRLFNLYLFTVFTKYLFMCLTLLHCDVPEGGNCTLVIVPLSYTSHGTE